MSVILELSIFPTDKGESVSPYVTGALEIIQDSGLEYELNAMGTCIEGDWPQVIDVVNRCFEAMQTDSHRIYMTIKADYRKDRKKGLKEKVRSVQAKLGQA